MAFFATAEGHVAYWLGSTEDCQYFFHLLIQTGTPVQCSCHRLNAEVKQRRVKPEEKYSFPPNRSNIIKAHTPTYSPKGQHTKVSSRAESPLLLCEKGPDLSPEPLTRSVLLKSPKGSLAEEGWI